MAHTKEVTTMRHPTRVAAAAALILFGGCTTTPAGPVALSSIAGDVMGYGGGEAFDVVAVMWSGPTPGATGAVTPDPDRLSATFVPVDAIPAEERASVEAFFAPFADKGDGCDLTVSDASVELAGFNAFRGPGDVRLGLATFDPTLGAPPTGEREYTFLLATRNAVIEGACDLGDTSRSTSFELVLVRGWNPVAQVAGVGVAGVSAARQWKSEAPSEDAVWWYQEPALEKLQGEP
jgi:hypothetical protein